MSPKRSFIRAAAVAIASLVLVLTAPFAFAQDTGASPGAETNASPTGAAEGATETPGAGGSTPGTAAGNTPGAAQAGNPDEGPTPEPGPPANYYASYGLIVIALMTIIAITAGYLFQAPGFRRAQRGSD